MIHGSRRGAKNWLGGLPIPRWSRTQNSKPAWPRPRDSAAATTPRRVTVGSSRTWPASHARSAAWSVAAPRSGCQPATPIYAKDLVLVPRLPPRVHKTSQPTKPDRNAATHIPSSCPGVQTKRKGKAATQGDNAAKSSTDQMFQTFLLPSKM
jgi:hypothetical protein